MEVKVIDNYLTKSYHKEIQEKLTGNEFPWYYNNNSTSTVDTSHFSAYGFSHSFWENNVLNNFSKVIWLLGCLKSLYIRLT